MELCVCGKEIIGTSTNVWVSCTMLGKRVIAGTCIHGAYFPAKQDKDEFLRESEGKK